MKRNCARPVLPGNSSKASKRPLRGSKVIRATRSSALVGSTCTVRGWLSKMMLRFFGICQAVLAGERTHDARFKIPRGDRAAGAGDHDFSETGVSRPMM